MHNLSPLVGIGLTELQNSCPPANSTLIEKNVTDFLYLVLHLAHKVTCYFWLFSLVLVSALRISTNVLSKSKSKNHVTWIANLTKLFLSVLLQAFNEICAGVGSEASLF